MTDAYNCDRQTLINAGYSFEIQISQPSFYRATVGMIDQHLKLEWVRDTAFRYFPVVDDDLLGYRLHDVDLAINKCLALANRAVVRDALDIIELARKIVPLPVMISAACGKDPGFTPDLMLEMMQRHMIFTPDELAAESLTKTVNPVKLKKELISLLEETRKILSAIPADDLGCLFVDKKGDVLKDLRKINKRHFTAHYGSIRGSWPRLVSE